MKATGYFYEIVDKRSGEVILNGIISESEDSIFPAQHTGNYEELPSECEAHKFNGYNKNFELNGFYFSLSKEEAIKNQ